MDEIWENSTDNAKDLASNLDGNFYRKHRVVLCFCNSNVPRIEIQVINYENIIQTITILKDHVCILIPL